MFARLSIALCFLPVLAVAQDQMLPDWVPVGIVLPQAFHISQDMTVGSTSVFIVNVAEDPGGLLTEWQTVLQDVGYTLDTSMLFDQRLVFSGNGFESAQITTRESFDADGYDIQVDAKQNME